MSQPGAKIHPASGPVTSPGSRVIPCQGTINYVEIHQPEFTKYI